MTIPVYVSEIIRRLEAAGYEAWCVGGCVRDSLLGHAPSDWDITTSATPDETAACFPERRLVETGRRHGTIGIVCPEGVVEATAYRVEGAYSSHRRPESVRFSRRLEDDLSRRDFTVNAMACHPQRGLRDLFGGEADLRAGVLRCVGAPLERFDEDALRILRCLRFSAALGFQIEPETWAAALHRRSLLPGLSPERTRDELTKLICGRYARQALEMGRDILLAALPELAGPDWQQDLHALALLPPVPVLRWAALLAGCPQAGALLERLRFSRREAGETAALLARFNEPMPMPRLRIKELLAAMGAEGFFRLLSLLEASRPDAIRDVDAARTSAREILSRGECLDLSGLAVTGRDLLAIGFPPGSALGAALKQLLDEVMADRLPNRKPELLIRAGELLGTNM